ncbi:hypothetical protein SUDANB145_07336 (plasmid) [Streptomyces sp. enrichment culture]|uniref:hypothetical protein n=1 Tax=Streptomyces sp. enrichment culture TaxID=1795815 RepID=UPI003F5617E5
MTVVPPVRVFTQNALTGEWLSHALPVTDLEYGPELSGPGTLTGKITPRLLSLHPELAEPATCIYVESAAGQIQWGGLVWDVRAEGEDYAIEAASWSSYLQKRWDIDGQHGGRGPYTYTDRCQIIRNIWAYAQSVADGDLGVTVDATTSTSTVGTPAEPFKSDWWDNTSLGDQVDSLVSDVATPEYTCTTTWNAAKTGVVKRIRLGWPRLGARRTDLTFASGVNIVQDPTVAQAGDDYAQVVIGTGTGDGSAKLRKIAAVRNGRLRMEARVDYPDVNGNDVLGAKVQRELVWRQVLGSTDSITIRDTPAAPFGAWQVGDDVYTRVYNSWLSWTGWCRVTGWTVKPAAQGGPTATISLKPSSMYQYGGV